MAELPRYRQLSEELRREIVSGTLAPGDRLPSERNLAERWGLSLNTVRQALDVLATAGLVERRHGSGTFVQAPQARTKSALVGVVVPSVTSFFAEIIRGIEDELRAAGHRLVLYKSGYDSKQERQILGELDAHGIDGLLIAPTLHSGEPEGYLETLRRVRQRLPIVFVERRLADDDAEFVSSDPSAGAALAVRHLAGLGHRHVAFVGPTRSAPAEPIFAGYRRGLAENGLTEDTALVRRHYDWGRRGEADDRDVFDLMALPQPPTGILCMGDQHAFRVYYNLRQMGRRVPEDVALVAYDNVVAHLLEVPLTAVSPPKYEVGRQAAALLITRLASGAAAPIHQILLKPQLVIRGTCGGTPSFPAPTAGETHEALEAGAFG